MKNLRFAGLLSLLLSAALILGSMGMPVLSVDFPDVNANADAGTDGNYFKAIDVLSDLNVIKGYQDGNFGEGDPVLRWHMALWIAKLMTAQVSDQNLADIWRLEENDTGFVDLAVDQYIGAIKYASDHEIIVGRGKTVFAPTDKITYQEALTMAVRVLGYGGADMDAGYPNSYLKKAQQSGLTAGIAGVSNTQALTRGESARILYNLFHAADSRGKTLARDVFNAETAVITASSNYSILESADRSGVNKNYVAFNIQNADGTVASDSTYLLPESAFGIEAGKADLYVGASYTVISDDDYKSLIFCHKNGSRIFTQGEIAGDSTLLAPKSTFSLAGSRYRAVMSFSNAYNSKQVYDAAVPGEMLVYWKNRTAADAPANFKADENGNILNKNGEIAAYFRPDISGSVLTPYVRKTGDTYKTLTTDTQIVEAGGVSVDNKIFSYAQISNTYLLGATNQYASFTAYDDNNDGIYDRGFYSSQSFGRLSYDIKANAYFSDSGDITAVSGLRFFDGEGNTIAAPSDEYIRYSYDPVAKMAAIYERYQSSTGFVTEVDNQKNTLTIGGKAYLTKGTALFGADLKITATNIAGAVLDINALIGRQVEFIAAGDHVARIFDEADVRKYIVFQTIAGINSNGYALGQVFVQDSQSTTITVATVDGYSYQNYVLKNTSGSMEGGLHNVTENLLRGKLFIGEQDVSGRWHIRSVEDKEYNYFSDNSQNTVYFKNGISNSISRFVNQNNTQVYFAQFNTDKDTVYIAYDQRSQSFRCAKGIPDDQSRIRLLAGGKMLVSTKPGNGPTADFIYIDNGDLTKLLPTEELEKSVNTIVYADRSMTPSKITDNLGGVGTQLGYTWYYGKMLDMVSGKMIDVYNVSNLILEGGKFYKVVNGCINEDVTNNTGEIASGLLKSVGTFYSEITTSGTSSNVTYSAYTYLYKVVNGNIQKDPDGVPINYAPQTLEEIMLFEYNLRNTYAPVYYYANENAYTRVVLMVDYAEEKAFPDKDSVYYKLYATSGYLNAYTQPDAEELVKTLIGRSAVFNYFAIDKNLYALLDSIIKAGDTQKIKLYNSSGAEVTGNWQVSNVLLYQPAGQSVAKPPIYTLCLQWTSGNAISGNHSLKFIADDKVYIINLNLALSDKPIILENLSATMQTVGIGSSAITRVTLQNGDTNTGISYKVTVKAVLNTSPSSYTELVTVPSITSINFTSQGEYGFYIEGSYDSSRRIGSTDVSKTGYYYLISVSLVTSPTVSKEITDKTGGAITYE